ncbi:DUF2756 family protein [Enterobacter sp. Bisph1]|uniref:DUF2756 family protein n=1 Tax=Enterobacter sp. Bisph1 TaxID=1274399 RepID=UPI00057C0AF6|nr:DUF2756 family protein [Enterobacter sp. Bisph1]
MKRVALFALVLPFSVLAQPLNTTNDPHQPGYVIPSQQRMQTQMLNQQQQHQGMLKQQMQTQTQLQQQQLQTQINDNTQRVRQPQPGGVPVQQQVLPNNSAGMLNGETSNSGVTQQHMLPQTQNGGMLQSTTPSTTP